jgi:hypothetical protein
MKGWRITERSAMKGTQVNFDSRQQVASIHLKYKIDKNLEAHSSHGLMTLEEVSDKILKNIYPFEDVQTAVNDAVETGHMNLYYTVCCDACGKETPVLETDPSAKETWKFLFNEGERCLHCGRNVTGTVKNISKLFAISSFKLSVSSEDRPEDISIFKRLISWLLPKKRRM